MYSILSVLTGAIIAVMLVANGQLSTLWGLYPAAVVIHCVGLVFNVTVLIARREKILIWRKNPLWWYLGGVIGVSTIVFNNLAYGGIHVSAIIALGLLGQSLTSVVVDQFGLFGMKKHPFNMKKIIGLLIVLGGILVFLLPFQVNAWLAVIVSLLAGGTVVLSRIINGKLAQASTALQSALVNYFAGVVVSVLIFLLMGQGKMPQSVTFSPNVWIYSGGILGVFVVLLSNVCVNRLPSFYLTLTVFLGQLFTGLALDTLLAQAFSIRSLVGGLLVFIGLLQNLLVDRIAEKSAVSRPESFDQP